MSQPRVTVTLGRGGKRVERRVSVRTEMYADCVNGVGNRKRSIRDRLGGLSEPVFTVPQSAAKRLRDVEGQWKHDMYFDGRDGGPRVQREQDLRSKLGQRQGFRTGNQARAGNNVDLRDKLSGLGSQNRQTVPANEVPRAQRRVASVVFNSSTVTRGVASTTAPAPVSARATATVKKPSDVPMVHNLVLLILKSQSRKFHAFRSQAEEQTVRTLLHSLGLEKYVITFQTEEIDMAALRFMSDNDLKELGVPMGPRKKILLAIRGKE
ncbi:uncharacterized protein [Physcomitrium patens]|uniref:SAM domain-containing protein n=1 Tax=Physcomitrium patens TaxID=3218 RepID=A0A7I4CRK5_PHYPA|nr:ankyrin repeat and SAM domain-containing protein 6-like isoform X1 [Physcomitrium patens]XP_024365868.1 ankyrin repeat and SAM domain-containing protein 6-like isoform X1 [Physcomitrium patens]|eukprot:XP_024365867.1 ankyrin repeat and SAM domain-containing protein 6-like isoform X1 [Physcomitrella patens]